MTRAAVVLFSVCWWLVSTAAWAQQAFTPARLYDGRTPDFRGIWQTRSTAYVNIEGHPAVKGIPAATSIVVDPPDGKIPYQPWALSKRDENFRSRLTADPSSRCAQAGVPRATYLPSPLQIVQSPGNFAIVYQDVHTYRIVYLDDRPFYERIDWWMGDSHGKWEGDSLVFRSRAVRTPRSPARAPDSSVREPAAGTSGPARRHRPRQSRCIACH